MLIDQNLQQFLTEVESDLLTHIVEHLRGRTISVEKAQQLARDFLSLLPPADKEDLLAKLNTLGKRYQEAQEVYLDYAIPHYEDKRHQTLQQMAHHIKQGEIEKAIEVAKGENQV